MAREFETQGFGGGSDKMLRGGPMGCFDEHVLGKFWKDVGGVAVI